MKKLKNFQHLELPSQTAQNIKGGRNSAGMTPREYVGQDGSVVASN
mgnify:CR=1 FL=1